MELDLAGGHVVNTDQDSKLLWVLRGARASPFGAITDLRGKVCPVPNMYADYLAFPLPGAATVLGRIEKLLEDDFPDKFSGDAIAAHPGMRLQYRYPNLALSSFGAGLRWRSYTSEKLSRSDGEK
ncbi:hypothetical protein BBP40_009467 [Aspergillus hancockii]|nr:hypothetical protein BBP40_009467 [Aspergillus hancockii]